VVCVRTHSKIVREITLVSKLKLFSGHNFVILGRNLAQSDSQTTAVKTSNSVSSSSGPDFDRKPSFSWLNSTSFQKDRKSAGIVTLLCTTIVFCLIAD
jgi:hypothetical protein